MIADLKRTPTDAVLFGVNQHTLLLNLDYIVFQDRELYPVLRDADAALVTHHRDLAQIYSGVCPDFGFSGGTAVWIADYLECSAIYICGCDCYAADRRYWHSPVGDKGHELGANPVGAWHQVKRMLQRPERVFAMSGPLTEVFNSAS